MDLVSIAFGSWIGLVLIGFPEIPIVLTVISSVYRDAVFVENEAHNQVIPSSFS